MPRFDDTTVEKGLYYVNNFKDFDDEIPTSSGLAKHLGVSRRTLYNWTSPTEPQYCHDEFLEVMDALKSEAERTLVNKGLNGVFNSQITKLLLGQHGISEKVETEIAGKQGAPVPIQFIGVSVDGTRKTD